MDLFCRITGNGSPVVILHGLLGMSDNWHSQAVAFANDHTVYIPDLRNHGKSPHEKRFDYNVMLDDLLDVLDRYNIENPMLIGHSMGGKLAMLMTLRFPELVSRLVVVDIHPGQYGGNNFVRNLVEVMKNTDLSDFTTFTDAEQYMASRLQDAAQVQVVLKNLYRAKDKGFAWKPDIDSIYVNLDKMRESVGDGLSCSVPALFVRGSRSSFITPADHTGILMKFPEAVITTIEGAGHWVHADKPSGFLETVRLFSRNL